MMYNYKIHAENISVCVQNASGAGSMQQNVQSRMAAAIDAY